MTKYESCQKCIETNSTQGFNEAAKMAVEQLIVVLGLKPEQAAYLIDKLIEKIIRDSGVTEEDLDNYRNNHPDYWLDKAQFIYHIPYYKLLIKSGIAFANENKDQAAA